MSYASPPTGRLRWAPPDRQPRWNGVRDAKHFRNVCPQVDPRTHRAVGSENCLFLNVWTPSLEPEAALPVMVWIHGGYLTLLSGGEPGYAPSARLAAETGVVYVSFNYRLSALGFLALEILREGSPTNTSGQR